jgi:mono/diheme cytochrome c family protein
MQALYRTKKKEAIMRLCLCVMLFSAFAIQAQEPQSKRVYIEATSATSGRELFQSYCAPCHGTAGKGDGPVAFALKTPPADLTRLAQRNNGKFPETYVAERLRIVDQPAHGSHVMPVWGSVLGSVSIDPMQVELRIYNIVKYIGSMQAK